jgi:probable HAF family extracellular repeat protein
MKANPRNLQCRGSGAAARLAMSLPRLALAPLLTLTLCLAGTSLLAAPKVKPPPPPPPPPSYQFVDLAVRTDYLATISEGGVVVGHLEIISFAYPSWKGTTIACPYVLFPVVDSAGNPLSWFVDANGDSVNDLVVRLPNPVLDEGAGAIDAHWAVAVTMDGNGMIWGRAYFNLGGNTPIWYPVYWFPNADGSYSCGVLSQFPMHGCADVSADSTLLLVNSGELILEIDWSGAEPYVTPKPTMPTPVVGNSARINNQRDVMLFGVGSYSGSIIKKAGESDATQYRIATRDTNYAHDMNASGIAVGRSATSSGGFLTESWATMWYVADGALVSVDLGRIPGISAGKYYYATGINDSGQVVGYCDAPAAFIWQKDEISNLGVMSNLGPMISNPPKGELRPQSITNDGIIFVERWYKVGSRWVNQAGLLLPIKL